MQHIFILNIKIKSNYTMMILYTHVFHKLYLVKSNDFYFNSSKLRINFILPRLLSVTTNFNFSNLIKSYVGNSGVYMFINNKNPTYIYVGSSLNIGRRLNEYKEVLLGVRKPTNLFTELFAKDRNNLGASWATLILTLCHPTEIRLYEQLAIYLFNPKLNHIKNISVTTRYTTDDLNISIKTANIIQNLFAENDPKHIKFKQMKEDLINMSNAYTTAKNNKFYLELNSMRNGQPVLVYNINTGELINYYSSSEKAKNFLKIKWKTLIESIEFKWIIKENLILSYNSISINDLQLYKNKDETYESKRIKGYKIQLIDKTTKIIKNEYKSIREAAYVLKTAQKTISSLLNTENLFRNTWYIKTK